MERRKVYNFVYLPTLLSSVVLRTWKVMLNWYGAPGPNMNSTTGDHSHADA